MFEFSRSGYFNKERTFGLDNITKVQKIKAFVLGTVYFCSRYFPFCWCHASISRFRRIQTKISALECVSLAVFASHVKLDDTTGIINWLKIGYTNISHLSKFILFGLPIKPGQPHKTPKDVAGVCWREPNGLCRPKEDVRKSCDHYRVGANILR